MNSKHVEISSELLNDYYVVFENDFISKQENHHFIFRDADVVLKNVKLSFENF